MDVGIQSVRSDITALLLDLEKMSLGAIKVRLEIFRDALGKTYVSDENSVDPWFGVYKKIRAKERQIRNKSGTNLFDRNTADTLHEAAMWLYDAYKE